MRVGRRTALGKKWTPIGVRPLGKQKIGYEYLYLYVSLKPFTGEMFAMFLPRLNKECFGIFAERAKSDFRAQNIDGGGRSSGTSAGSGKDRISEVACLRT